MNIRILSSIALGVFAVAAQAQLTDVHQSGAGTTYGRKDTSKLSFYGAAKVERPSGAGQAAITDNSGGTAATTIPATVGVYKLSVPLTSLATGLSTSAIDLATTVPIGHAFKVLSWEFVTTIVGTGTSASQTFNLEIGTTNLTGGSLALLLADTNTIGKRTAASAITAANTGTAEDTLSIEMAASGTVFTAGAGYFLITIQNMDTANAIASLARQGNALRSALAPTTGVGLLKGGP